MFQKGRARSQHSPGAGGFDPVQAEAAVGTGDDRGKRGAAGGWLVSGSGRDVSVGQPGGECHAPARRSAEALSVMFLTRSNPILSNEGGGQAQRRRSGVEDERRS